jgi:hypothetical protein
MPSPLERHYERTLRIDAPLSCVWQEIATLRELLACVPEVEEYELEPSGRQAHWRGHITLGGRVRRVVRGRAEILDAAPRKHMAYTIEVPVLAAKFLGIFALASGGEGVTVLGYRGSLVCHHRFAAALTHVLIPVMEDHVESVTARIGRLAAQHVAFDAQMRLRQAPNGCPPATEAPEDKGR